MQRYLLVFALIAAQYAGASEPRRACELLSQAEASAIVGTALAPGTEIGSAKGSDSNCRFMPPGADLTANETVGLFITSSPASMLGVNDPASLRSRASAGSDAVEAVTGLGESAFIGVRSSAGNQEGPTMTDLWILKAGRLFTIAATSSNPDIPAMKAKLRKAGMQIIRER